jgi:hypothetical protein
MNLWRFLAVLGLLALTGGCGGGGMLSTDPRSLLTPTPGASDASAYPAYPPGEALPAPDGELAPGGEPAPPYEPLPTPTPRFVPGAGWQEVYPGLDYRQYTEFPGLSGIAHVVRLSLERQSHPDLTVDTLLASGMLLPWAFESVESQAQRYTGALNYWGDLGRGGKPYWGKRNRILVAINGSLVDTQTRRDDNGVALTIEGYPNQGMVQSGWYFDRFQDFQNRSGFVWSMSGQAFIGGCVSHPAGDQRVLLDLDNPDTDMRITGINVPRDADRGLFLYTHHYGPITEQKPSPNTLSVEVVLRLESPLLIKPPGESGISGEPVVRGEILEVRVDQPPARIEFDQVVLSATGFNAEKLLSHTRGREGQQAGLNLRLRDGLPQDCQTPSGNSWSEAYAAIGVDALLVEDGRPLYPAVDAVAPRTAVAMNADYLYLLVVEGRPYREPDGDPARTGIPLGDLANFITRELDGLWAANLDGGGSSTLLIDGQVMTRPGDFLPMICPQQYLPGVVNGLLPPAVEAYPAPDGAGRPDAGPAQPADTVTGVRTETGGCQRPVINSLAIVLAEEPLYSELYQSGEAVTLAEYAALRQGPGYNYAIFERFYQPLEAHIEPEPHNLNGIYASGVYWWYVRTPLGRGWVEQEFLIREQSGD